MFQWLILAVASPDFSIRKSTHPWSPLWCIPPDPTYRAFPLSCLPWYSRPAGICNLTGVFFCSVSCLSTNDWHFFKCQQFLPLFKAFLLFWRIDFYTFDFFFFLRQLRCSGTGMSENTCTSSAFCTPCIPTFYKCWGTRASHTQH